MTFILNECFLNRKDLVLQNTKRKCDLQYKLRSNSLVQSMNMCNSSRAFTLYSQKNYRILEHIFNLVGKLHKCPCETNCKMESPY